VHYVVGDRNPKTRKLKTIWNVLLSGQREMRKVLRFRRKFYKITKKALCSKSNSIYFYQDRRNSLRKGKELAKGFNSFTKSGELRRLRLIRTCALQQKRS